MVGDATDSYNNVDFLFQPLLFSHSPSRNCNLLNNASLVMVLNRVTRDIPVFLHSASLLHAACHYNNTFLVKQLLDRYPSLLYTATSEGYTPIHVAFSQSHLASAQLLVESHVSASRQRSTSGALPRPRVPSTFVNQSLLTNTTTGHSVVHFAVALNNLELLSLLVQFQKQLSLSLDSDQCGYTPLHLAVHLKHVRAANLLLVNGASPNSILTINSSPTMSTSPLAEATVNNDKVMVEMLIKFGAEDKRRDALSFCLRQEGPESESLVAPLLGSLVKCDEVSTKQLAQSQSRKEGKRLNMGMVDWSSLDSDEMKSEWVRNSLSTCIFFRQQGLEPPLCFDYVSTLNLNRNKLSELPIELFHLKNLTNLNVSLNQLTSLPVVFPTIHDELNEYVWPCPNLSRLNISSNQLRELPEYLFELPNLNTLDASKNAIESLSFYMWCSPKLNNLNCSHNRIKAIPTNWPDVKSKYQIISAAAAMSPPGKNKNHMYS